MVTPLLNNDTLDVAGLERLIGHLPAGGGMSYLKGLKAALAVVGLAQPHQGLQGEEKEKGKAFMAAFELNAGKAPAL